MASCFFISHRDAPDTLRPFIYEAVLFHIVSYGVSDFVVGHYGNFDSMAAQAVIADKRLYPDISLTLLIPYHPSTQSVEIRDGFDGSHYPPDTEGIPFRAAIMHANKYSIDHSDYLIAYARYAAGNTRPMLEYAMKRARSGRIHITDLAGIAG